jgi:hypothetical protein
MATATIMIMAALEEAAATRLDKGDSGSSNDGGGGSGNGSGNSCISSGDRAAVAVGIKSTLLEGCVAADLYLLGIRGFIVLERVHVSDGWMSLLSLCAGSLPSFDLLVGDVFWME